MAIELANTTSKKTWPVRLRNLTANSWSEATVDIKTEGDSPNADELRFYPAKGALLIDDVLLFEPAEQLLFLPGDP